jgi:hypothetical protein
VIRVVVRGEDYADATSTLVRANQLAASTHEHLVTSLGRSAGMAGDDTTSAEFGAGYDAAARESVGALAELADAFATLARLTERSLGNHRAAEDASSLHRRGAPSTSATSSLVGTTARTPPSCVGGDAAGQPELWHLVVDHLQGWAWPSADTDALREAAAAWRRCSTCLAVLPDLCQAGSAVIGRQQSPEVPAALDAISDLSRGSDDLGRVCDDLARACDELADDVDEHRETVRGILEDLALEVGLAVGVGVALSFFTFGGGAVVGTAVVATRTVAAAHRIVTVLSGLRSAASLVTTSRVTSVTDDVRALRAILARFQEVDRLAEAAGVRRATAVDDWRNLPRQLEYTWDAVVKYSGGRMTPMEHIREGHWPDSTLPLKGHFAAGVTEKMVMDYVDEAVRAGQVHPMDGSRIECDLTDVIGTDRDGLPTSTIRIHIRDGVVRTAFPVASSRGASHG